MSTIRPHLVTALAILALAGCNEDRPAAKTDTRSSNERSSHAAAAAAMDTSFENEMGPAKPKPVEKPAEKPVVKPAPEKPKPRPAEAKPAIVQGRPAWVDQLPQADGKLFAVGGAAKGRRDEARRKALSELASSLRVRVQATATVDEGEIAKIGPGGERVGRAWSNYRNEARLTVDRDLTFATISAEAEDGSETWALVELDRNAWAAKLRQEVGVVDERLVAESARLSGSNGGLRASAQTLRAIGPLAGRRDILVADLILADPQAKPPACPIDLQGLFAACAKGLATVSIKLEGAPDAVFGARTQDALARQGLIVNERDATVVLRLALRETARELPNKWTRINVAGSATVVDPSTGNIAGSLQIDESAADPDAAQAKAKMLDKASVAVAKAIDERLIDLLGQ